MLPVARNVSDRLPSSTLCAGSALLNAQHSIVAIRCPDKYGNKKYVTDDLENRYVTRGGVWVGPHQVLLCVFYVCFPLLYHQVPLAS